MQKYIYTRFPSETVTRSGYQVSCSCSLSLLSMLIATCTLRSVRAAEFAAHTWYPFAGRQLPDACCLPLLTSQV